MRNDRDETGFKITNNRCRAVHSGAGGGAGGQLPPSGKINVFFSNMVFEFSGLFLVGILVRNRKKTD